MPIVKQQSVEGGKVKLKKLKNDTGMGNSQYKYVVELPDGDRTDARFSRSAGEQEFDRVVSNRSTGSSGGGFLGTLASAGKKAVGAAKKADQKMVDAHGGRDVGDAFGIDGGDRSGGPDMELGIDAGGSREMPDALGGDGGPSRDMPDALGDSSPGMPDAMGDSGTSDSAPSVPDFGADGGKRDVDDLW